MGNCSVFYDELRFDVRDPNALHAYVFIRCEGDCMHTLPGWHHKAFSPDTSTQEVINRIAAGEEDFLTWRRGAPRPVETPVLFYPSEKVPVSVEHLEQWRKSFTAWNSTRSGEMADQIAAYLAAVPDWGACCPQCRARSVIDFGPN